MVTLHHGELNPHLHVVVQPSASPLSPNFKKISKVLGVEESVCGGQQSSNLGELL